MELNDLYCFLEKCKKFIESDVFDYVGDEVYYSEEEDELVFNIEVETQPRVQVKISQRWQFLLDFEGDTYDIDESVARRLLSAGCHGDLMKEIQKITAFDFENGDPSSLISIAQRNGINLKVVHRDKASLTPRLLYGLGRTFEVLEGRANGHPFIIDCGLTNSTPDHFLIRTKGMDYHKGPNIESTFDSIKAWQSYSQNNN